MSNYKVKLTLGDAVVEVEGAEIGVLKIVDSLKGVFQGGRQVAPNYVQPNAESSVEASGQDIRSFLKSKDPKSHGEAAAVVAFYLRYLEDGVNKRETIDAGSMLDEFRKADWKLPKVPAQVLIDAKKAGYFDAAGTGTYRLNTVGYNLVKHALGTKETPSPQKTPGRKRLR